MRAATCLAVGLAAFLVGCDSQVNEQMESEVKNLQGRCEAFKRECDTLKEAVDNLRAENAALDRKQSGLGVENDSLKKQLETERVATTLKVDQLMRELAAAKAAGGAGAVVTMAPESTLTPRKATETAPRPATPAPPTPLAPAASPAANQTYMVIPINGPIGENFPSYVKTFLDRAAKLKPSVIVLDIDTPGGRVVEAEQAVDLVIQNKNFRFVALVRSAISAGAMMALACNEIFMTDTATIGAAVSYVQKPDGSIVRLPPDVAEKEQSIWRAVCRKAAEHGGHDSLLAEAMVDLDFTLTMRKASDRVVLERDGTGTVLKANGKILTMTAREAVACGLAKGLAEDVSAVLSRLGIEQSPPASEQLVADIEGRIAALRPKVGLKRSKIIELDHAKVDQRMIPPPGGGIRIINGEERIYNFEYKDIGAAIKRGDFRTQREKEEAIRKAREEALPMEQELKALQDELAAAKAKLGKLRAGQTGK